MSFIKRLLNTRAPRTLDARAFVQAYASAARARFPDGRVGVQPDVSDSQLQVRWTLPDGSQAVQSLGNAYTAYSKTPAGMDAIIAAHLDAAPAGARPDPETRRAAILPVIKTRMWLTNSVRQLQAAGAPGNERFVTEPLSGELLVVYAEDRPDAISYVAPEHLDDLGLRRDALKPLAVENLRRMLPQLTIEGEDGCYGVRLDGNYDASLIFQVDAWRDRVKIDGEPVLAVPAREELLVCGSNDRDGQRKLRTIAAQVMARSPYGLSALLYAWRDGALVPYDS